MTYAEQLTAEQRTAAEKAAGEITASIHQRPEPVTRCQAASGASDPFEQPLRRIDMEVTRFDIRTLSGVRLIHRPDEIRRPLWKLTSKYRAANLVIG